MAIKQTIHVEHISTSSINVFSETKAEQMNTISM